MTLYVNQVGDQPFAPGAYAYSYNPDQLIAGGTMLVTEDVNVVTGTALPRGTVLGRTTNATIFATATTGNTGNGTVGSLSAGAAVEAGSYTLTATSATVFAVTDPEGVSLGNATAGTAFTNAEINFTITAGGTAFVAGDSFKVTYEDTLGNFIVSVKTASDGSQTPVAILADYCDASAGNVKCGAFFFGEFNARAVSYDSSWALSDLKVALAAHAIFLKSSVSAADPLTSSNDVVA